MLGYGTFDSTVLSDSLYAKWIPEDEDKLIYKILLVFVDEFVDTLETTDGKKIEVDYKMTQLERAICRLIPSLMSIYLNEWFEGSVFFEVDAYFTTTALGAECLEKAYHGTRVDHYLYAKNTPELKTQLSSYRSILTTFSMNDYDYLLHNSADKYGMVYWDSMLYPLLINDIPIESLLDVETSSMLWHPRMSTYLHEFAHTAELLIEAEDYHDVISHYYNQHMFDTLITRLYLLSQAKLDGKENVGIPSHIGKVT